MIKYISIASILLFYSCSHNSRMYVAHFKDSRTYLNVYGNTMFRMENFALTKDMPQVGGYGDLSPLPGIKHGFLMRFYYNYKRDSVLLVDTCIINKKTLQWDDVEYVKNTWFRRMFPRSIKTYITKF